MVEKYFEAMLSRKILVIGDAMRDIYVYGRLAPSQDGCQKFMEMSRVEVPGGAANAARSIFHWTSAQCPVVHPLPVKTRFISDTIVFRHDQDLVHQDAKEYASLVRRHLGVDAVLISDYDKGLVTQDHIREIVNYCASYKIPCVADVKRHHSVYEGAILKCNSEYPDRRYCDIITRGADTPLFRSAPILGFYGRSVPCRNHVGAGDCFAAHLTLALAAKVPIIDACMIAHSAGRIYVQYEHNRPPLPTEIINDLRVSYTRHVSKIPTSDAR